jgi:aminoglycoside phosphotransferase (APT) family kinase protein
VQAVSDPAELFCTWLEGNAEFTEVRIARRLAGGNANVTSLVETATGPLVLRHPPTNTVSDLAGAGIAREFRFISAISGNAPVAEPILFCEDAEILGAPFSLTRFVQGTAITDVLPPAYSNNIETIDAIGIALIDALAKVHAITPVPEGLGDVKKARNFVVRQIERWRAVRLASKVRDLPLIETLGTWLADNAPEPETARIVHCDYHLDNVLMDPIEPKVRAILDWEMATLADPLVDVGLVTAMWNRDESLPLGFAFVQRVSNVHGAIEGGELAQRWSNSTGLSIEHLHYFQAFALWRLAVIVEGAYVLFRNGQVDGPYERGLEHDVPALLDAAQRIAQIKGMA